MQTILVKVEYLFIGRWRNSLFAQPNLSSMPMAALATRLRICLFRALQVPGQVSFLWSRGRVANGMTGLAAISQVPTQQITIPEAKHHSTRSCRLYFCRSNVVLTRSHGPAVRNEFAYMESCSPRRDLTIFIATWDRKGATQGSRASQGLHHVSIEICATPPE